MQHIGLRADCTRKQKKKGKGKQKKASKQEREVSATKAKMKAANNIKLESFKVGYKLNLLADEAAYMLIIDSKIGMS